MFLLYCDIIHYLQTRHFIFNNNRVFIYLLRVFGHWPQNILLGIILSLEIRVSEIKISLSIASCSSWAYNVIKKVGNSMLHVSKSNLDHFTKTVIGILIRVVWAQKNVSQYICCNDKIWHQRNKSLNILVIMDAAYLRYWCT